jgi:Helix-turn-helix domain
MAGPHFADRKEARVARHGWRGGRFCILPIEVLKDTRLTPRDLRVLIALHAFKDRFGCCWPSRGLLAEMTGLSLPRVSSATTRLAAFGWLRKEGNGGRSRSCRYWLRIPETVTESVTVTESDTKTVTDPVTQTVSETERGREQTMNGSENRPLLCAEPQVSAYAAVQRPAGVADSSVIGPNRGPQAKDGLLADSPIGSRRGPRCRDAPVAAFDRFWSVYPKKRNKGDAWKAWRALKPGEDLVIAIVAAVARAKESVQWRKDAGQFIPYPATWLRARGWEDEEHVDVVPLTEHRGEKGRIASSVAALQTLFGDDNGKGNLPAGNGLPRRRVRG